MKKLCNSKVCYLVAQEWKKVNSSKNGRFRYEMIVEIQPEMELLELVTFIYPSLLKAESSIPSATRIWFFNTASLDFIYSFEYFLKTPGKCSNVSWILNVQQTTVPLCFHSLFHSTFNVWGFQIKSIRYDIIAVNQQQFFPSSFQKPHCLFTSTV